MAKALVLFQVSVFLLSSFTIVSHAQDEWYSLDKNVDHLAPAQAPKPHHHHHHHHHPHPHPLPIISPSPSPIYYPTKPPTKAPTKPPTKAPCKPPTPSPYYPSRKPVAVRGLVYCKPCKFRGINTLYQAKPLQGAKVKLVCYNTKKTLVEQAETDENGFFWILPKLLSSGAYHKCKVFLVSSNNSYCNVPTNYNDGKSGALLKYTPPAPAPAPATHLPIKPPTPKYDFFTVGPFGFEPSKKVPCKKY
ncbi:hypothetical protein AABB24_003582 [Solanum stoloniferum]|uniref:TTS protein n=1 Tax=Solanum stoloniferum TaxID=62892 RepID=A0ABD2V8T1_9SOLN